MGTTVFDVNVILSEPDSGFGCGDDADNAIGICCAGLVVPGRLTSDNDNEVIGAATTEIMKTRLVFKLELSEACAVNVNWPTRLGVPLISPVSERLRPSGKDPLVRVQV